MSELKAYQVGDNDIVAAYDQQGAIAVLVEYCGVDPQDFEVHNVALVSDNVLDANEVFDQDEGKRVTLDKTLRQELSELTEPSYMIGWE